MSNNILYSPNNTSFISPNLNLELPSISNLTSPLLVSNVFGINNTNITTFTFDDDEFNEISIMEEGLLPKFKRSFKKKKKIFTFAFKDKGKKIKKITI